ncbi:glucose-1-phosphate thymidylyltransferase [Polycladomyces subterraneus]|uniref:Glucose-1-phosphate thymidylyltransferase n=1 Tax=Polycladomyces subterraneus TaxID=1016997 RepID=A0ABT8IN09_9BACL|nr:glucose-1-phosphate thymidylyltransferase [Polycladomyces subterraneus]MDN4594154.1 glucose-1-phosphate thymidylyltransferase [Polycladomyces subterraneus]
MKGLILCAGKGSRLRPLTFSQPKTLLPVANKPVLMYAIEQLVHSGIDDIGIVINPFQEKMIREQIRLMKPSKLSITWIHQKNPQGIADAVRQAEQFIGKEPFLLLLGDNLIQQSLVGIKRQVVSFKRNGAIMLARVENPREYGIAQIEGDRIVHVEEKPSSPKSNLAIIGAYAFDHNIFTAVRMITPSVRGEYEITDAIQWLIDHGFSISFSITDQHYSDVGTVSRWLEANHWKMDELTAGRSHISPKSTVDQCTIIDPVFVGEGCTLKNAIIGPYVSIQAGVTIEECQMESSIILEGAHLKRIPFKIKKSVFGRYVQFSNYLKVGDSGQLILGDRSSMYLGEGEEQ